MDVCNTVKDERHIVEINTNDQFRTNHSITMNATNVPKYTTNALAVPHPQRFNVRISKVFFFLRKLISSLFIDRNCKFICVTHVLVVPKKVQNLKKLTREKKSII